MTLTTDLRALALRAVTIAKGYAAAGTFEVNPNRGDQVEWFQHAAGGNPGESWCADFVYACLLKAYCEMHGLLVGKTSHDNRVIMLNNANAFSKQTKIPRTGYCPTVAAEALKSKRFHSKAFTPLPGDLVLYRFDERPEPHHIGFVLELSENNTLRTVEGNTSAGGSGSQANGDGVYQKVRTLRTVYGFVHFE